MITITRRLAKQLKAVLRQALNLTARAEQPTVQLTAGSSGLCVRSGNGGAAAEFRLDGEYPAAIVYIPLEVFADVESARDDPVQIACKDGKVTAAWHDGQVAQLANYDAPVVKSENWPPCPKQMTENRPALFTALRDAVQTTDSGSYRFALGCIQFRGSGELVATDGCQALVQGGFSFPWKDDVLVPASKVFASRQLPTDQPVYVGRAKDWAVFRIGPWTFWLAIQTEARFPNVAAHVGQAKNAVASCTFDEADRKFLLANLPRLPCDDNVNEAVTVDLNGCVALRSKTADQEQPTELVLSASKRSGEPLRINTNRRYLRRAIQLGFDRVHLFGPEAPPLCQDESRSYVWAVLGAESAVAPSAKAVRIESGTPVPTTDPTPTRKRSRKTMPRKTVKRTPPTPSPNGHGEPADGITAAIEQAEAVRTKLREAATATGELITTLKRQRKQSKIVRSTLASLKQLQAIDA